MDKETILKAYKTVFDSKDGELVIKDLLSCSNALSGTYSDNPHKMAFNEGRRSLFFDILDSVDIDLKTYRELSREVVETDWAQ